jgi:hypothetical protein
MAAADTRAKALIRWMENHPIVGVVIVLGAIVIAIGMFSNAIDNVFLVLSGDSARQQPAPGQPSGRVT